MHSPENMEIDRPDPPPNPHPPDLAQSAKRKASTRSNLDVQTSPSQKSPDYKSPRKSGTTASETAKVVTPSRKPRVQQTLQGAFITALEVAQQERKKAKEKEAQGEQRTQHQKTPKRTNQSDDTSNTTDKTKPLPPKAPNIKRRHSTKEDNPQATALTRDLAEAPIKNTQTKPLPPKAPNITPTCDADGRQPETPADRPTTTSIDPTHSTPARKQTDTIRRVHHPQPKALARKADLIRDNPPGSNTENDTVAHSATSKKSFADIAKAAALLPPPLLPQWKLHRFAVTFEIKMPKDRSKRTEYLATELNKLLQTIAKTTKVFVRKYKEHHVPRDSERHSWIKQFKIDSTSDLTLFTHGFYMYQALRDGVFRLQLQLIIPVNTDVTALLMDINGNKWACKKNRSIRDIREQNLFDPKPLGWLFRSNYAMVNSTELQDEFETMANNSGTPMSFGLTFKTIPNSNPGKPYDKDTAIKAVCVSTNAEHQGQGWELLMKWYNSKKPNYPLNIPLMFVPSKDHPDIRNNPIAAQNVSTITDRQKIFLRDTETIQCTHLADPAAIIENTGISLRTQLSRVTATVSADYNGGNIFHAITKKCTPDGDVSFYITYHKCVEKEARSIIGAMGQFIQTELSLDPEDFCHAHLLDSSHRWDPVTRSATNDTTDYLSFLVDSTQEYNEIEETQEAVKVHEDDVFSMDTKGKRESKRVTQIDDAETVDKNLQGKKKKMRGRKKDVPAEIEESQSVVSNLTGDGTKYSSASQASAVRKELRATVDQQEVELEEKGEALEAKESEIKKLREAMKLMMQQRSGETSGVQPTLERKEDLTDNLPTDNSRQSSGEGGSSEDGQSEQSPTDTIREVSNHTSKDVIEIDGPAAVYSTSHSEVEIVPPPTGYVKHTPTPNFKLPYIFRGPATQIEAVKKIYDDRGEKTRTTTPDSKGYVELHRVELTKNHPTDVTDKQGVSFEPYKQVAQFDPTSTAIDSEIDDVSMDMSSASSKQSIKSSSSSSASSSGSSSSSSTTDSSKRSAKSQSDSDISSIPPASRAKAKTKKKSGAIPNSKHTEHTKPTPKANSRISNITNDIIQAAKNVAVQLSNTNGGGPEDDV